MTKSTTVFGLVYLALFAASNHGCNAFYLPGVSPSNFAEGDPVKLKVNKMTSSKTLMPVEYYHLPFCKPRGGVEMDNENLGEFLAGDRIESSPYVLQMKKEMFCQHVCIANLGPPEQRGMKLNSVTKVIKREYHNNWIVDNLSAASKAEDETSITTRYWQGFPVGFVDKETNTAFVHNHVNVEIMYHPAEKLKEGDVQKYRIVRFTVEPFSIKHEFKDEVKLDLTSTVDDKHPQLEDVATIVDPIASCSSNIPIAQKSHTSWDMVMENGRKPQEASGKVLFTYDVHWVENLDVAWASRWDIYLSMDNAIPAKVHWLSIANSLVIVVVLSGMVIAILLRNLRQDLARYNRIPTDEEKADDLEEKGWKLVHADVFRPPAYSPLLLSACCGTGAQLLCMSFWTIVFSAMGFLSPARRGALLMAELLFFVLMGSVNGYVTARLYKTFKGKAWQNATLCTALGFPGLCFSLFFMLDLIAWAYGSSDAVPFTTILVLLVLWFGISTPLVFVGAYFGYKQDAIEFPVKTSNIPRQIPDQPWFMSLPFTITIGGLLPFGACFVELYFILASVWMDYYYYVFGFLFLVFLILIITCAEITLLFNYFQLCNEDYHWWWRSFTNAGSTAVWVFLYSFVYFKQLESNSFTTYVLYFGYMGLVSFGLFLMTGFVGVATTLWFNITIFGSVKVD
jgi:transmembrane 9 superfamily protein 2/4